MTRLSRLRPFVLLLVIGGKPAPAAAACIAPQGNGPQDAMLNDLLAKGGPGAQVVLCDHSLFPLSAPVRFTAAGQSLTTAGYPTDGARAILRVEGPTQAIAISGQCPACSGITLRNLQVDGNRPALGRLPHGAALIEMGGNVKGQTIEAVRAYEPRGWSTLHVFEGARRCRGVAVLGNDIGPAGQPNGAWADGISYACAAGHVANNLVTDATDGGIVVFEAPGTLVDHNRVVARTRILMGGINMVDYKPYAGDYTGTLVRDNMIDAEGAMIKVGLAIGPAVWGNSKQIVFGGWVSGNRIEGDHLGYGIAVNGVSRFTVIRNTVTGRFGGAQDFFGPGNHDPLPKCNPRTPNPPPTAFLLAPATAQGSFSGGAITTAATFHVLICLQPK
jgi:hypothetical protein